jgi:hypothetical protein
MRNPIKIHFATIAALGSLLSAIPAAQAGTLKSSDESRKTIRNVVDCVVDYDTVENGGKAISAYFSTNTMSPKLRAYITECVKTQSFKRRWVSSSQESSGLLRGEIARSIVANEWGGSLPGVMREMARTGEGDPLRTFGLCVAGRDATNARSAIDSQVGSPRERAAYAALKPVLATCVKQGQTVRFSKQMLEGALAQGLFAMQFAGQPEMTSGTNL